jgi:hypothetical protein
VVLDSLVGVLPSIGMRVVGADAAAGTVTAKTAVTFYQWGENVVVRLWEAGPGHTGLSVTSSLKFGFADPFGFNQRNVDRVVLALGADLDHRFVAWRTPEDAPPA